MTRRKGGLSTRAFLFFFAGSYPTLYFFGKDKANPLYVNEFLENQDEENLMQFIKNQSWVGAMDEARAMDEL